MRDILLVSFIGLCLAAAIRYPFAGLLTWAWFTLMTPHQAAFGVFGIPLNMVIAAVTLAGYVFSGEISRFKFDPITSLLIAFAGWLTLSQLFSLDSENSAIYYERFMKALVFMLLCIQMTRDKLRFNAVVWTGVLSLGFFAAKGAIFTAVTLGAYRVQGLQQTVLEDNNHFGIAIATILPLILYLRGQVARPWMKTALLVLFGLSIFAVIGTHSRGAFLALVAFGGFFWLRSNRKLSILAGLTLLIIPAILFMPSKWTERMGTISEATQDASFMGRVDAWVINYKLAKKYPLTGAGLRNSYEKDIAITVDPMRAESAKAAHSIYFEVMGGAGFVGLAIYLALFATAFFMAWRVYLMKDNPAVAPWKSSFAFHAQLSLAIFAVGGASTSMEMWEGYLMVIALIAALNNLSQEEKKQTGFALKALRGRYWKHRKSLALQTREKAKSHP